jgi:hypothetical protein
VAIDTGAAEILSPRSPQDRGEARSAAFQVSGKGTFRLRFWGSGVSDRKQIRGTMLAR